jgi:hypothetical protein
MQKAVQKQSTPRPRQENLAAALPSEFLRRIEICKKDFPTLSNCIGAALFISGEIENDCKIDVAAAYSSYLMRLRKVDSPKVGCLIAWTVNLSGLITVEHIGIVTAVQPEVLVTYRMGSSGIIMENQPIEVAGGSYRQFCKTYSFCCKEEYFLPRVLE